MSIDNLTTLAAAKSWLNVSTSDDDAVISALIAQVSRALCNLMNRSFFLPLDVVDVYDGSGRDRMLLRQWPVAFVVSVTIDGKAIPQAKGLNDSGWVLESASPQPPGGLQNLYLRGYCFNKGVQNIQIAYRAGYQISAETASVPRVAPYQFQAVAPYGAWAKDMSASYVNGAVLTPVASAPKAGQYAVDPATGVYSFAAADAGAAISFDYGYIPTDLEKCALEWVADSYRYRDRIGQSSKSLGGQETASFRIAELPPFVNQMLQQFTSVVSF